MFERYSERSRRIIFLSRKIAGQRGAAEIGVEDMLEALVAEDQGEFASVFSRGIARGTAVQPVPQHRAYFTAETAAAIRSGLEPLMVQHGEPLPTSADMPINNAMKAVLERAQTLSEEGHEPTLRHLHYGRLEPLHLLAAVLDDGANGVAGVLRSAGITRDAVMDAMQRGESA